MEGMALKSLKLHFLGCSEENKVILGEIDKNTLFFMEGGEWSMETKREKDPGKWKCSAFGSGEIC